MAYALGTGDACHLPASWTPARNKDSARATLDALADAGGRPAPEVTPGAARFHLQMAPKA